MDEHRDAEPGRNADPVPRDLPDQQVREGEDPWDVPTGPSGPGEPQHAAPDEDADESTDVPDTDEAGTARRDAPRSGGTGEGPGVEEEPAPEESTG
ncbi:hypothetical protein [Streptomyces sp. JB150]|uniref:hypothetical protein n=1 Tax=Streptomyces sp. JB150 TaxID=2714844 RepID=UPI00140B1860|nr:hypothetical protein [Streptomyces sp. JB150]QIJ66126.1 hypothetical protein G7Z13_32035 [Streptomyces sp. JB150]